MSYINQRYAEAGEQTYQDTGEKFYSSLLYIDGKQRNLILLLARQVEEEEGVRGGGGGGRGKVEEFKLLNLVIFLPKRTTSMVGAKLSFCLSLTSGG
jgi:hypothetical protein